LCRFDRCPAFVRIWLFFKRSAICSGICGQWRFLKIRRILASRDLGVVFRANRFTRHRFERDRLWFRDVEGQSRSLVSVWTDCANPGNIAASAPPPAAPPRVVVSSHALCRQGRRGCERSQGTSHLRLEDTRMTSAGFHELARLEHLEELNLDSNDMDDDGLKRIDGPFTSFESSVFADSRITDAGIGSLASLTSLHSLHLIGHQHFRPGLADLLPLHHLTELWLINSNITSAGLNHLAKISSLKS